MLKRCDQNTLYQAQDDTTRLSTALLTGVREYHYLNPSGKLTKGLFDNYLQREVLHKKGMIPVFVKV